jgi:hypothetical protein
LVRPEADDYTRMRINFGFFYKLYPIGYSFKQPILPTRIGQGLDLRPESVGAGHDVLAGVTLGPHLNHLPRAVVGASGQQEQQ